MDSKPVQYVLTLSEEQASLLSRACEFYARIKMGQFDHIIWECLDASDNSISVEDFCKRRELAEEYFLKARKQIYPDLMENIGHSYGVMKFEDADIVWEIYEVLRNKIAWHNHPNGGMTVNFCKPTSLSGRKLAKCEVKYEQDQ